MQSFAATTHEEAVEEGSKVLVHPPYFSAVFWPVVPSDERTNCWPGAVLEHGDNIPGWLEAWPALEGHPESSTYVILRPWEGERTPRGVLDLPGVLIGRIAFGIEVLATITDGPITTLAVNTSWGLPGLLRRYLPHEMKPMDTTSDAGPIRDWDEDEDHILWQGMPPLSTVLEILRKGGV